MTPGGDPRHRARPWLGPVLLVAGLVALAVGIANAARLLAAPLDAQRGYLAPTIFPLVAGLWLLIAGLYILFHRDR